MDANQPSGDPVVCGLAMASACGIGERVHRDAIAGGMDVFRPLGELFPGTHPWSDVRAGWLPDRSMLCSRRFGPASALALELARQAVADAGWGREELCDCAVVVGSSRGNAAGWLDPWPGRRRVGLLSAPNSLHSELASTISIEMGIEGPYHVLSSGCAAGLDAVGLAGMLLRSGEVQRAIAVGLDLPLTPALLDTYWTSRMLSLSGRNDPYHPAADGMIIAEGGAALALAASGMALSERTRGRLVSYGSNSDAWNPLGMRPDGARLAKLICAQWNRVAHLAPDAHVVLCPHASGTRGNAVSETAAWQTAFTARPVPDLRMLKPFVGHTIGGSGILELAMLLSFASQGFLPPNPQHAAIPEGIGKLSRTCDPLAGHALLIKTAASMGGHNALVSVFV